MPHSQSCTLIRVGLTGFSEVRMLIHGRAYARRALANGSNPFGCGLVIWLRYRPLLECKLVACVEIWKDADTHHVVGLGYFTFYLHISLSMLQSTSRIDEPIKAITEDSSKRSRH